MEDIIWDLEQALDKSQKPAATPKAAASNGHEAGQGHSILSKAFGAPYQK